MLKNIQILTIEEAINPKTQKPYDKFACKVEIDGNLKTVWISPAVIQRSGLKRKELLMGMTKCDFQMKGDSYVKKDGTKVTSENDYVVVGLYPYTTETAISFISKVVAEEQRMERYAVAEIKKKENAFKPEDFIKFISGKPADKWLSILMDEYDLTESQSSAVAKLAEEQFEEDEQFEEEKTAKPKSRK